ncbi:ganglioside GM2 activator isoform X1 [Hydra vulgaris]|uniref:ganglioside GM2 activator isoform X1 n=1 Tax=Hydra vulgaris TaxID=6087 RepID=UPI001F5F0224|nr:ganglioside GM2 activator isoform X1 [Hydra vulgaris]
MSSNFALVILLLICNSILQVKCYFGVNIETQLEFDWTNCGDKSVDPIVFNSMNAEPDPVNIPGNLSLSLDAVIKTTVAEPTLLQIIIKKKFLGKFFEVPCLDNIGSCNYSNPCDLLQNIKCPSEVVDQGWNCRCPLTQSEIKLEKLVIIIPKLSLPSFIENGEYEIKATLNNGGEQLFCYQIHCSLHSTGILVH